MKENKQNRIDTARESLDEILGRIGPYMPKTPKTEQKQPKQWRIVGNRTLPPLNSLGHDQAKHQDIGSLRIPYFSVSNA